MQLGAPGPAWPSPDCCRLLGNEPVDGSGLLCSLSASQINENMFVSVQRLNLTIHRILECRLDVHSTAAPVLTVMEYCPGEQRPCLTSPLLPGVSYDSHTLADHVAVRLGGRGLQSRYARGQDLHATLRLTTGPCLARTHHAVVHSCPRNCSAGLWLSGSWFSMMWGSRAPALSIPSSLPRAAVTEQKPEKGCMAPH